MLITTAQLHKDSVTLDESLPEGAIDYTADIHQAGPLSVKGKAELIEENRGHGEIVDDIRLRAKFAGKFELLCARCLDPVNEELKGEFDLIFRPEAADAEAGERAITEEETEIGYYGKSGLLLEDAIREQVLLALPGRTLCREDCQGLCPHCGANRNSAPCRCEESQTDPRWNALAGLAGKVIAEKASADKA
jgi:uncharacterized protein